MNSLPGVLERDEVHLFLNNDDSNKKVDLAYKNYAQGQTLIFGTSIAHCENIAAEIEGAVVVSANTKNRDEIIRKFTNKEIKVLVNCMIFTEGTDIPLVETIIICRPTKNSSLYAQMVGRSLRLHKDKDKLNLIDLVGVTGKNKLCAAASLLGLNVDNLDDDELKDLDGNLLDIPNKIKEMEWIRRYMGNREIGDLTKGEAHYILNRLFNNQGRLNIKI